jgi:hypothetical protein
MQAMRAIGAMVLVLGLAPSLASMIVPEERLQLTGDIGGTHDPGHQRPQHLLRLRHRRPRW